MLGCSIKNGTINQTTLVDNLYLIACLRHFAMTFGNHLILQTARQYLYTRFLGISSKELLAGTSQSFLLEIGSSLRGKECCIISQSCDKTILEHSMADRIACTLQLFLCARIYALLYQFGNLHTCRISYGLRIDSHGKRILVTTKEILHIGSIYLKTLLDIRNQTTSGIHTSYITQRIG